MNIKSVLWLALLIIIPVAGFAQEKSKKEQKAERKLEMQKQTEILVNAREFVFVAKTAYPTGGRSMVLSSSGYGVNYHPDLIESYLPFFGRAYSGVGYGGNDKGLTFTGKPEAYTVTGKKNGFLIKAEVKAHDTFRLTLDVDFQGGATLSVLSNNRSSISFRGSIVPPVKSDEVK